MKFNRVIRHDGTYRSSLMVPPWPSKAFDRMAANGGLNLAAAGTPLRNHVDQALLSVTRRCTFACEHCYERFNLGDEEIIPLGRWQEVVREIQEVGTGVVTLTGGEPFLRYEDLLALVEGGDKDASEFHVHTSGHGVTLERAVELKAAGLGAAAVGLDHHLPEHHDQIRGHAGAFSEATAALGHFHEAGLLTYLNTCLGPDLVRSGGLPRLLSLAGRLGATAVRLLEPCPCGGYFGRTPNSLFSESDRRQTEMFFLQANRDARQTKAPLIIHGSYAEAPELLGCRLGGLTLFHIDAVGNVAPCVFVPVSFGNIREEDFPTIWQRMRIATPRPLRSGCAGVNLAAAIRQKHEEGVPLPIPYPAIEREWTAMWEAAS